MRCADRGVWPELILHVRKDEDLATLLKLPLAAGHAQRKALDALFAGMDASGDGEIDEDEFVRYFADKAVAEAAQKAAVLAAEAAAAAEEALSIHERIVRIYKVHNPPKVEQIDALLAEWEGEEEVLYKNIKEKYAVPDDFFAPETPASAQGSSDEESESEDAESAEERGVADKARRSQRDKDEIAARYQWMVDLQAEQDGDSAIEQDTEEEESAEEGDETATDDDEEEEEKEEEEEEGDDDDDEEETTEDEEETTEDEGSEAGSASEESHSGSERSVEHDGDLGVPWDEENLSEIQRRAEFIKQAKIFRVKITRDSTGRGTYTSIYAPENQEGSLTEAFHDAEMVRKQAHVDKIAQVGEAKTRWSLVRQQARHAKLADPELQAIAAAVRAKINDGRPERPWQKKLKERWKDAPDDFGMYSVESEMVQALKERKKLREEAEAAKSGSLLVAQYQYGSEGGVDADDTAGEEELEHRSEDGEEQEIFRVVRPRGNLGRLKMSRVTATKKKKRTAALTPRGVRNQLMLDKLSDVQRKDAEAAAAAKERAENEEDNAQSAESLSDDHLPRAKANRNINLKHADGSSSWIRQGQIIVITESERGQPYKGYLEGSPQNVGVFLKSKIIIRTEEQLSMFADVSDTVAEDEHEKKDDTEEEEEEEEEDDVDEARQTNQGDEDQDLAATGGTEISRASTKRSGLAASSQSGRSRPSSITSSQRKSPPPSADAEDNAEPVGACRFCGFVGPVSGAFSQTYGSILTVILHINDAPCCWNQGILRMSSPTVLMNLSSRHRRMTPCRGRQPALQRQQPLRSRVGLGQTGPQRCGARCRPGTSGRIPRYQMRT